MYLSYVTIDYIWHFISACITAQHYTIYINSDIRFVVGEERQTIYAHKCLLAAR